MLTRVVPAALEDVGVAAEELEELPEVGEAVLDVVAGAVAVAVAVGEVLTAGAVLEAAALLEGDAAPVEELDPVGAALDLPTQVVVPELIVKAAD
jgi:hypothetical protein